MLTQRMKPKLNNLHLWCPKHWLYLCIFLIVREKYKFIYLIEHHIPNVITLCKHMSFIFDGAVRVHWSLATENHWLHFSWRERKFTKTSLQVLQLGDITLNLAQKNTFLLTELTPPQSEDTVIWASSTNLIQNFHISLPQWHGTTFSVETKPFVLFLQTTVSCWKVSYCDN